MALFTPFFCPRPPPKTLPLMVPLSRFTFVFFVASKTRSLAGLVALVLPKAEPPYTLPWIMAVPTFSVSSPVFARPMFTVTSPSTSVGSPLPPPKTTSAIFVLPDSGAVPTVPLYILTRVLPFTTPLTLAPPKTDVLMLIFSLLLFSSVTVVFPKFTAAMSFVASSSS